MTGTPHRATAEQWNRLQGRRLASDHVSAIIELRARVETLESRDREDSDAWTGVRRANSELRAARRPKPPSLKELALKAARIELVEGGKNAELILRALEALPDD